MFVDPAPRGINICHGAVLELTSFVTLFAREMSSVSMNGDTIEKTLTSALFVVFTTCTAQPQTHRRATAEPVTARANRIVSSSRDELHRAID